MMRWNIHVADKLPKVVAHLRSPPAWHANAYTRALYLAIADRLEQESKMSAGCAANNPHKIVQVKVLHHPGWSFTVKVDYLNAIDP